MGISFNVSNVNPYYRQGSYPNTGNGAHRSLPSGGASSLLQTVTDQWNNSNEKTSVRRDMLDRLRSLDRMTEQSGQSSLSAGTVFDSMLSKTEKSDKDSEDLLKTKFHYNFKELSGKIQRAKNSTSAGEAVLAAKRKVLEMKRKLASAEGNGDSEEIELALNHAKQMELAANRKKRHLELEEMATTVGKRDEDKNRMEEAMQDMKNAMLPLWEDELTDGQTELMKEQTEIFSETAQSLREQGEEITDEMIGEMDAFIEEATKEQSEMLEELSKMLESLEVINPHMSEEDLKELKTRHRTSEDKELLKADMEYLKEYIKLNEKKGSQILSPGMGHGGSSSGFSFGAFSAGTGMAISISDGGGAAVSVPAVAVDVQV
ncbi:MAG: hypothetical protein IJT16_02260 [Lachnospiraceae bacterium]|nr:hypothetical protein [Lachnospiraceae bacterium]